MVSSAGTTRIGRTLNAIEARASRSIRTLAADCKRGYEFNARLVRRLQLRGQVMRTLTTSNTYAPTMMIGKKGAAMIKEDAK